VTALAVAVHDDGTEKLTRIAIAPLGGSAFTYRLEHPLVIENVRDRLHGADAIVIHGAAHWMPRLINAGLAPRGAAATVICTQELARIAAPNSVAATGASSWDTAFAIASLVAPPQKMRPAGPLGIPAGDVAAIAETTAELLPMVYSAAEERMSRPLVKAAIERMRSIVSSGCRVLDADSPVTDSEPLPVPVAVAGVTRNQFDCEPEQVFVRVSLVAGIAPEVARYAPVKKSLPPSPSVVALAEENGIDLSLLEGSGVGGRVVMADVKNELKRRT